MIEDTVDHNSEEVLEQDNFNENSELAESSHNASLLYGKDTSKYEKMRTMLPEGAVRQKMMVDGWSQDEIEEFFGNFSSVPGGESVPIASNSSRPTLPFSLGEQIKFASNKSGNAIDETVVPPTVSKPPTATNASPIPNHQNSTRVDEELEEESDFFAEQDDPYSLFGNKRTVSTVKVRAK